MPEDERIATLKPSCASLRGGCAHAASAGRYNRYFSTVMVRSFFRVLRETATFYNHFDVISEIYYSYERECVTLISRKSIELDL
ncbi:hypothetical protein HED50_15150 [Ochrobactrum oryzae]|nr:hypothetical protein [Brucella oryzae]